MPLLAVDLFPTLHTILWIDGDVARTYPSLAFRMEWDLMIVFGAHLATLFAPEIVGALCGYATWRACATPHR